MSYFNRLAVRIAGFPLLQINPQRGIKKVLRGLPLAVIVLTVISLTSLAGSALAQNPTVVDILPILSTRIDVIFSTSMGAGATDPSNYTLSGAGKGTLNTHPDLVTPEVGNPKVYDLDWNVGEMKSLGSITITVTGVSDDMGNPIGVPNSGTSATGGIGFPPTVQGLTVPELHHLIVSFDEAMDTASGVLDPANYTLSGTARGTLAQNPASVMVDPDPRVFHLMWNSGDQRFGGVLTITVSSGTDLAGNPIGSENSITVPGIGMPPEVSNLTVDNIIRMSITFSEVLGNGALEATNYTLSGIGKGSFNDHPDLVEQQGNSSTYRLTWNSGEMRSGGEITITVANVMDETGVPLGPNNSYTVPMGGIGIPPYIAYRTPDIGGYLDEVSEIEITFSEPVSGVSLSDIEVNGGLATEFEYVGDAEPNTWVFRGYPIPPEGPVIITILGGGIYDEVGNLFVTDSWIVQWDTTPPTVSSVLPAPDSTVSAVNGVDVTFSEPVRYLQANLLTLNGFTATAVMENANPLGPHTFSGFLAPPEGQVSIVLAAGAAQDYHNYSSVEFAWTCTLIYPTPSPSPTPSETPTPSPTPSFSPTESPTPSPSPTPFDDANFAGETIPAMIATNNAIPIQITVRNTGNTSWSALSGYGLEVGGTNCSVKGDGPFLTTATLTIEPLTTVNPGDDYIFKGGLLGPVSVGSCSVAARMIVNGVRFGASLAADLTAVEALDDSAAAGSTLPPAVGPGSNFYIGISLHNTGTTTWSSVGGYSLEVLSDPCNLFSGANTIPFATDAAAVPNLNYQFITYVTVPSSPTTCAAQLRLKQDASGLFGATVRLDTNIVEPRNAAGDWSVYE